MRRILAIAWKDALVRFSSKSELLFFIVLPILFTFLIGGGTAGLGASDGRVRLLVVDEDNSAQSAQVAQALEESALVRPVAASAAEAQAQLANGDAAAVLLIPAGFGQALVSGAGAALEVQRAPNDPDGLAAETAVAGLAQRMGQALGVANSSVQAAEQIAPFASAAERQAYYTASLSRAQALFDSAPARLTVTQPAAAQEAGSGLDAASQASAGQLITWVFIPLVGTSALFAYERSRGTLRRLITTPTSKATFLLGAIVGQLGTALVQMVLLVGFGIVVMGLAWGQSPAGLALILVTFGLASVALGVTLGTFVKTESQATGLSIMLGMTLALLGGCWYPLEFFPEAARTLSLALPTRWAMQGLSDMLMRGQGLAGVWPESLVLLGFAAVFFAVGVKRFRYE